MISSLDNRGDRFYVTRCPGGVLGDILEPGMIGLREFEPPRVRTRISFRLVH